MEPVLNELFWGYHIFTAYFCIDGQKGLKLKIARITIVFNLRMIVNTLGSILMRD
jgi:hypothetical protein